MVSSHVMVLAVSAVLQFVLPSNSQEVTYTLKEETYTGTKIGNILNDSSQLNRSISGVEYRILTQGNEFAKYFRIDNRTGDIFTAEVLDRESLSSCEFSNVCKLLLEIIAQAPGGTYFKKVRVQFLIEDINDNLPRFPNNQTRIELPESSVVGSYLSIEGAVDLDIGANTIEKYEVTPASTPFVVESDNSPTIKVKLTRKIDRELQDTYSFRILAIDGGSPRLTGTLEVTAIITDINDNKPQFSQSVFNITIDEDLAANSVILNISAVDPDAGANGEVVYRLSPYQSEEIRNMFAIDPVLGNLTIIKSLTYQPGETMKIIVEASDNAVQPLISQAIVYARVLDSTNDVPEIHVNLLSSSPRASIAENATIGAAVAHVKVTDDDLGLNGYVNCSVMRGNSYFRLEKLDVNEYKVTVAAKLDRENIPLHDVTVTCWDFGTPSLNTTSDFAVEILDINEEPPKFLQNTYKVQIEENNLAGASILTVSAVDSDSGMNAKIKYSLQQTGRYDFVIDSVSGEIRANFVLDRESVSEISFKVAASDSGAEPKTGLATVILTILDANDNSPKFPNQYMAFSVLENQPVNSYVGQLSASDNDTLENGVVKFASVEENLPLVVLPNGTIFTSVVIDREKYPHGINFKVIAYDLGKPESRNSSAFVTVLVSDVNDNAPILLFPNDVNRTITMVYDLPEGTVIGRVEAEDQDYSINAKLSFSIHEKSAHLLFRLDSETGEIRTARKFSTQDINRYAFTVIVEDQGVPKYSVNHSLTVAVISNNYEPLPRFKEDEGDNYLLIAVIISCVTIVLAGVIILVIFLLRRIDEKKREHVNATLQVEQPNTPKPELYDALDLSQSSQSKMKNDKRVSFSDSLESFDTPIERRTFKMTPSKEKIEELLDRISTPPSTLETRVRSLPQDSTRRQNPRSQLEKMKLQKELLQLHTSRMASLARMQDDNGSETSIESNTSDSGRGGSESDIHSSAGHSHLQELADTSRRKFPVEEESHKRVRPQVSAIHLKDIQPKFADSSHQTSEYKVPRPSHFSHQYHSHRSLPSTSLGTNLRPYHYVNFKNSHEGFQRTSISDVISESVATYDEYDNASTTTSGSYTVDDLDADFRSDIIV